MYGKLSKLVQVLNAMLNLGECAVEQPAASKVTRFEHPRAKLLKSQLMLTGMGPIEITLSLWVALFCIEGLK